MTDDEHEWFEERAAIREYDGKLSRDEAEEAARLDWRDWIDREAERIKRQVKAQATSARRSLGQSLRHARTRLSA